MAGAPLLDHSAPVFASMPNPINHISNAWGPDAPSGRPKPTNTWYTTLALNPTAKAQLFSSVKPDSPAEQQYFNSVSACDERAWVGYCRVDVDVC